MRIICLIVILIISMNLAAADVKSEVSKQMNYSWPSQVMYSNGVLKIDLLKVPLNKKTYTSVIQSGVCILEAITPNILHNVHAIQVSGINGNVYTFNGGSSECQKLINKSNNVDKYIFSKTTR